MNKEIELIRKEIKEVQIQRKNNSKTNSSEYFILLGIEGGLSRALNIIKNNG